MANPEGKGGWLPGQSGNPHGRPAGIKLITDAIKRRLQTRDADEIAQNLIEILKGQSRIMPQVLQIVLDRTEGPLVRDTNLNLGVQQSSVVLLPRNGREHALQLTASGEVLQAEGYVAEDDPCEMFIEEGDVDGL